MNLLSKTELKNVMGGRTDVGNCGAGYVGYTCRVAFAGSWGDASIACVPSASGGSSDAAAEYLLGRYLNNTSLCVSPSYCETSCS